MIVVSLRWWMEMEENCKQVATHWKQEDDQVTLWSWYQSKPTKPVTQLQSRADQAGRQLKMMGI